MGIDLRRFPEWMRLGIIRHYAKGDPTAPVYIRLGCEPAHVTHQAKRIVRRPRPRLVDTPELAAAKRVYETLIPARRMAPMPGPVLVAIGLHFRGEVEAGWHVTRPDADNSAKALLDALAKAGYLEDDAQVACLIVAKRTTTCVPFVEIHLAHIGPIGNSGSLPAFLADIAKEMFHEAGHAEDGAPAAAGARPEAPVGHGAAGKAVRRAPRTRRRSHLADAGPGGDQC